MSYYTSTDIRSPTPWVAPHWTGFLLKGRHMKKILLACLAVMSLQVFADELVLRDDYPSRYVVVKGDTLWDISAKFLHDPWLWPEIWVANEYIANPHLIYPGDILTLVYLDGKPRLMLQRNEVVKLSPNMRDSQLNDAIPSVSLDAIRPFLSENIVLDSEHDVMSSPYVVSGNESRIISGVGDQIFARGDFGDNKRFSVYRKGDTFVDPSSGEVLGYQLRFIGSGKKMAQTGDIATITLNRSVEEIRIGDHVLPSPEENIVANFFPSAPENDVDRLILAVESGVTQIGQHSIVIVNAGAREGLATGHVLAVERQGEIVKDPYTDKPVQLPAVRGGLMMIVKVFSKLSFGLIMESNRPLEVGDKVTNP
jgi:hypothetical protein